MSNPPASNEKFKKAIGSASSYVAGVIWRLAPRESARRNIRCRTLHHIGWQTVASQSKPTFPRRDRHRPYDRLAVSQNCVLGRPERPAAVATAQYGSVADFSAACQTAAFLPPTRTTPLVNSLPISRQTSMLRTRRLVCHALVALSLLDSWAAFSLPTVRAAETIVARSSRSLPEPRLEPIEELLLADARDGELRQFDMVEAALVASGATSDEELARWLRVRDARYAAVDLRQITRLPLTHRPAAVLSALHREILAGRFHPTATLLPQTLASGDFNCVTATVLYYDLCSRVGVPVEIVAQSGHVNCRLVGPPQQDVEATRRDWFERSLTERASLSQGTPAGVSADASRRVITPVHLLGRIYYNRALADLEQKDFSAAISRLQVSLQLDPSDRDAQENLLAALNNWALALCEQQEFASAVERIDMGLKRNPRYQTLLTNDLHVHQQWALHLCREGSFAEAVQVLEAGSQRQPQAPLFTLGQKSVFELWLKSCISRGDSTAAAQVLRQAQLKLGPQASLSLEASPVMRDSPVQGRRTLAGETTDSQ
jgi:Tfp pilus assembly protein PilF